jgi:hypothetical protein
MSESPRLFTYEQALATFPTVFAWTEDAVRQVEALRNRVASREESERRHEELEEVYHEIVRSWSVRVTALGCEVKGAWLVDWDSGGGYYCWRYPEPTLSHYHGYEDGFGGRMPIH